MKKLLVTGGAGFLGTHLVQALLDRNIEVSVLDLVEPSINHPKLKFFQGSVLNKEVVQEAMLNCDGIFHLSGLLGTSELFDCPEEAINNNIQGAVKIILSARRHGIKRIVVPSKPNTWNNVYSATSTAIETLSLGYNEHFDMDIRIIKLHNLYGPYQKIGPVRKIVPDFIVRAFSNKPIEIFGSGSQLTDMTFCSDAAEVLVRVFNETEIPNKVYELNSDNIHCVKEVAEHIIRLTGSKSTIRYLPVRKGESTLDWQRSGQDVSEIIEAPQYIDLDKGLCESIVYYSTKC